MSTCDTFAMPVGATPNSAFLQRRVAFALGLIVTAWCLVVGSSATAQQPVSPTTTPAISPITSMQTQEPLGASANANQAVVSQIINQLNQRQLQLNAVGEQSSPSSLRSQPEGVRITPKPFLQHDGVHLKR
jgi:hypothetical protein